MSRFRPHKLARIDRRRPFRVSNSYTTLDMSDLHNQSWGDRWASQKNRTQRRE